MVINERGIHKINWFDLGDWKLDFLRGRCCRSRYRRRGRRRRRRRSRRQPHESQIKVLF